MAPKTKNKKRRLNHFSRHTILVRCKQSFPVCTHWVCVCVRNNLILQIPHCHSTAEKTGYSLFFPVIPLFLSLSFTPDCVYECVCACVWESARETACCANSPLSLANLHKSPSSKKNTGSYLHRLERDNQVSIQPARGYPPQDPGATLCGTGVWVCVCAYL